ncbi:argininosuccinate synthase [Candidatus Micrarchaeota archaeon CG10_big_fil_rev_8_21_14_0_10_45_29]|nr:MAG: argininosuccinate synthase [Candidatus Micrarchaeota archaeon CG10_big_fil_rev_8_21_14_0_10_45_29]
MAEKILLAYSGGLDTSVCVYKLVEEGYDVIAASVDLGQMEDLQAMRQKALKLGAKEALVLDAKEDFVHQCLKPAICANALYEGKYALSTSLARAIMVKKLAKLAKEKEITLIANGCKGKGSDASRFMLYFSQLYPQCQIVCPIAKWNPSRAEETIFAEEHNIPIPISSSKPYSYDDNMWGNSANYGAIEDAWEQYPQDCLTWSQHPAQGGEEIIQIGFEGGEAVSLNGEKKGLQQIIDELNKIGKKYAVGITDLVEDQIHGGKGRYIYEAPAAHILIEAHKKLESLTLPKSTLLLKQQMNAKWAELCYDVFFYSPAKDAVEAFILKTQKHVNGEVKIKLSAGKIEAVGVKSKNSMYNTSGKKIDLINGYECVKFSEVNENEYSI